MTNQHPITPPPELVDQWHVEAMKGFRTNGVYAQDIATQAAQWGADQELDACVKAIKQIWGIEHVVTDDDVMCELRAIRRPKPPSLKEQALAVLDHTQKGYGLAEVDLDTIRRALEALDEV